MDTQETEGQPRKYLKQLSVFRDRLLNIDPRNPSIFLRKASRSRGLDLRTAPNRIEDDLIRRAVKTNTERLLLSDVSESDESALLRDNLRKLARADEARQEESGLRELHVGFCWIQGFLDEHTYARAPLLLVPAKLTHRKSEKKPGWYLSLGTSAPLLNKALIGALQKLRGWASPEDLLAEVLAALCNENREGTLFGSVADLLGRLQLPFSSESSQPAILNPLANKDLADPSLHPLRLVNYLVVGLFPQSNTALYADMQTMIERAAAGETDQGIVDNLLDAAADDPTLNAANFSEVDLDTISENDLNIVLESDPSQDQVLARAQSADCVVVRGPPGTGKSQVIVNMIAGALSRSERVLVVCQKRAALDVVYDRLGKVGLEQCAHLVHDENTDRQRIYGDIRKILASSAQLRPPTELARTLGERIDGNLSRIRELVSPLARSFHGLPLYELYRRATPGFVPRPLGTLERLAREDFASARRKLERLRSLQANYIRFDAEEAISRERQPWLQLGHTDRLEFVQCLRRIADAAERPGVVVDVPNGVLREVLVNSVATHNRLRNRWYRFLAPSWYRARRAIFSAPNLVKAVPPEDWAEALTAGAELRGALEGLRKYMKGEWVLLRLAGIANRGQLAADLRKLADFVEGHFEDVQQHERDMLETGLEAPLLDECATRLQSRDWADHIFQELLVRWIEEAEASFPQLRGQPSRKYEELRGTVLAELEQKRAAVAQELCHRDWRSRLQLPNTATGNGRRKSTEEKVLSKLEHEVSKKSWIKPLRALLSEYGDVFKHLAPCWLTSPEVVSEVFPLEKGLFDLIIFDEASQLAVERALPVIYRGKRIVIAGDEKQMPPSSFFQASWDEVQDSEEEQVLQDETLKVESLLLLSRRIYRPAYLSWHYRSEHQELINFSNHAFYDGRLNVAANTSAAGKRPPIEWHSIRGTWANNRNQLEAEKAVQLLHEELRTGREEGYRSIAILTFNAAQMELIKDEIERNSDEDADFAELFQAAESRENIDERPVVKNVENIQGDERDVVIFSVGYGPDPQGTFRRLFGPLSLSGGENRLNVAITRAKKKISIICSFDPEALAIEGSKNLGPVRFKQYLCYAKAVSDGNVARVSSILSDLNDSVVVKEASSAKTFDSEFEEQVHDALVAAGYNVHTQIGLSGYRIDLAVVDPTDPTRYCLGIECDGAAFHSGRSARERDIARQRFLESRKWRIARIWSRDWWLHRDREIARIVDLLRSAVAAKPPPLQRAPPPLPLVRKRPSIVKPQPEPLSLRPVIRTEGPAITSKEGPLQPSDFHLSKTTYIASLHCNKQLWWRVHEPTASELTPSNDLARRFDWGRRVGERARDYLPPGILVSAPYADRTKRLAETESAIRSGAAAVFEGTFLADGVEVRVDALLKGASGWTLVEVKSGTKVQEHHKHDLALQAHVLKQSGLTVDKLQLMHLNKACRFPDLSNLFTREDLTEEVLSKYLPSIEPGLRLKRAALSGELPTTPIGAHCEQPYSCPFQSRCWGQLPADHVTNLYRERRKWKWLAEGITRIADLPEEIELNAIAERQRKSLEIKSPIILPSLAEALGEYIEPLAFLDFETVMLPIPVWSGCCPYAQMPVQFSCHLQAGRGWRHHEWIAADARDPREALGDALIQACEGARTIVAYNSPFESKRVEELAESLPQFAGKLMDISARLKDLLPTVRDHIYFPAFEGNFSLKTVLPTLVPGATYADLEIAEGATASLLLEQLMFDLPSADSEAARIRARLLEYCKRDSWATVQIFEKLRELATRANQSAA